MYAYSGILTALLARATSGQGATIDVSLFDALGEWMAQPAYYAGYGGAPPARTGADHASIAPYGPIRAADGGHVFLAVQNAREWRRFSADVLNRPELADDERFRTNALRVTHRRELSDAIASVLGTLASADIIARLDAAGIAYARMNDVGEYLAHPQRTERDVMREIGSAAGPLRATVPPVRMSGVEPRFGDVPSLGQHTDAILTELGINRDTIGQWRAEGVI
jgi:crotonobetainyl-CoA:carnitine CoA-transferase CaiB-like acyl-CoA transferase